MNRLIKTLGTLTLILLIGSSCYYLYANFADYIRPTLTVIGLLTVISLALRLLFDKDWIKKLVREFFIGNDLIKAIENYYKELPNPKSETKANLVGHLIYRFTRFGLLGLIGILIAASTPFLVWQQNKLFGYQNERIDKQTTMIETQTGLLRSQDQRFGKQNELIAGQNEFIKQQTGLLERQDVKFGIQNQLLTTQNALVDTQNYRLNLQNNLIEAERRGALVILMSNIMDQMNEEINKQKYDPNHADSLGYALSDPLIGRIAALSQGFIPYRYLEGDTLSEKAVSPERGQLLLALSKSKLDSVTYDKIYLATNFQGAYLEGINLRKAHFGGADLRGANLRGADLSRADLRGAFLDRANLSGADLYLANLRKARLYGADLSGANLGRANLSRVGLYQTDLSGANLHQTDLSGAFLHQTDLSGANLGIARLNGADLSGANLLRARNLTYEQLTETRSLYQARGLLLKELEFLEKEKPCLFEDPLGSNRCKK